MKFMTPTKSLIEKSFGMLYYSTSYEGINGRIRIIPEDFIVEEITPEGIIVNEELKRLDRGKGKVTLAVLKKISKPLLLTISILRKKIRGKISFAGIKDRRAITYQLISINKPFEKEIEMEGIKLWTIGRSKWEIYPGELNGNRFTITIRCLENFPKSINIKWLPNYFGHQRFGISRPNTHKIGKLLIKGDFEEAIKEFLAEPYEGEPYYFERMKLKETWDLKLALETFSNELIYEKMIIEALIHGEKPENAFLKLPKQLIRLFIEAYQSYIFNLALSERWKRIGLFQIENGDYVAMLDSYNNPSIPIEVNTNNLEKLQKMVKIGRAVILIPIPGVKTKLRGINEEIYEKIFLNEKIEFKNLIELGISIKGTLRPAVFYPLNFEILNISNDEKFEGKIKATIRFSLPKGSYATILLRELIKPSNPREVGF
ncbi:MAG: tRNA pseudouridine(13) synthase TruD [Candidatus Methanomethylicaceae archaeon]|nr:tRNA pseudouridine(13) synthase TruD [Candidatus Verstraetearchaeota archaeon]